MKATAVESNSTRIVPALKLNKCVEVKRQNDGSMDLKFGNGKTGTLSADDIDIQAFVVWTMLNGDCTKA